MKHIKILIATFIIVKFVQAQSITLTGQIYEYATYYISNFDLNTGATNVQIFRYELSSSQYPVTLKIRFKSSILSPSLGINSEQTIIEIETFPIQFQAPVIIDNRDISSETVTLYDMDTPPNPIEITGHVINSFDPSQLDAILQSVFASGQLADGQYYFQITILSENDEILESDSASVIVDSPSSISLESPGGQLADTLDNVIYTTYPTFQWFSEVCNSCNLFLRVAEFNSQVHSSMEEAMNDQRVLPFDQSQEWYQIENVNSFQYPFTESYPMEEGRVYCWQVMMTTPTTSGIEEIPSDIIAFKIGESGNVETQNIITNQLLIAIQQAIGDDQFSSIFGSGNELENYLPTGQVEVNGIDVDESSIAYLLSQIQNNTYQIQSITVE